MMMAIITEVMANQTSMDWNSREHMGVSETGGTHNGWLVCFMEDPNLKSMRTTVGGRNPAPPL